VGLLQFAGVIVLFFPSQVCRLLGYSELPEWMRKMQENQMTVFLSLFFLSSFAQNFANTGAFEISLNGKVLFSKLETGRLPTLKEISETLEQYGVNSVSGGRQFGERNF